MLQCEEHNLRLQTEAMRLALQPTAPRSATERVPGADIARATRAAQKVIELQRTIKALEDDARCSALCLADAEQSKRSAEEEIRRRDGRISSLLQENNELLRQVEALHEAVVDRDEQLRRADRDRLTYHEAELREKDERIWTLQASLAARDVPTADAATDPFPSLPALANLAPADNHVDGDPPTQVAVTAAAARARAAEAALDRVAAEGRWLVAQSADVATALALVEAKVQILESLLNDVRASASLFRERATTATAAATAATPQPLRPASRASPTLQQSTVITARDPPPSPTLRATAPWRPYRRPSGSLRPSGPEDLKYCGTAQITDFQVVDDGVSDYRDPTCVAPKPRSDAWPVSEASCCCLEPTESQRPFMRHRQKESTQTVIEPNGCVLKWGGLDVIHSGLPVTTSLEPVDPKIWESTRAGVTAAALPDGSQYVGEWGLKGEPEGAGILQLPNKGVYTGQLRNGRPHGPGVFQAVDGGMYQGEWADGLRHGHGVEADAEGLFFGPWCNGRRHGMGVMRTSSSNKRKSIVEYLHGRAVRSENFPAAGAPFYQEAAVLICVAKAAALSAVGDAKRAQELCSDLARADSGPAAFSVHSVPISGGI